MEEDVIFRYKNGRIVPIKVNKDLTTNEYMNNKIKKESKKEQPSLTNAKQRYKNNIYKYGAGSAFEDAILFYSLRDEEIDSLYRYIQKTSDYENYKGQIDTMYNQYRNKD